MKSLQSSIDNDYEDLVKINGEDDIRTFLDNLRIKREKLRYFEQEYEKYVDKILFDYDKPVKVILLNLLINKWDILDELVLIEPLIVLK
jgi:hypothetical protein